MVIWISGGMPFASCFVGFLIYLTMSVPAEGKSWLGWPILVSFLGMWVVRGFPRKSVGEKTRAGPDVQEKAEPPRPRTRRMPGKGITVLVLIVGFFVAGYGSLLLVLSWSGQVEGLIWQAIPITFLGLVLLGLGIRSKFP
jgi:hypothetical protein